MRLLCQILQIFIHFNKIWRYLKNLATFSLIQCCRKVFGNFEYIIPQLSYLVKLPIDVLSRLFEGMLLLLLIDGYSYYRLSLFWLLPSHLFYCLLLLLQYFLLSFDDLIVSVKHTQRCLVCVRFINVLLLIYLMFSLISLSNLFCSSSGTFLTIFFLLLSDVDVGLGGFWLTGTDLSFSGMCCPYSWFFANISLVDN